jgi:hypothetical protein
MRNIEQQFPVYAADLDDSLTAVTDPYVIRDVLDAIGVQHLPIHYLLVDRDTDGFVQVWGAFTDEPTDATRWYDLLD